MLEELADQFQIDAQATLVDASTKLALEWAEQQSSVSEQQLNEIIKSIVLSFKMALPSNTSLSSQSQASVIKSATRLTNYWYMQNKSTDLKTLNSVIQGFVKTIAEHLA